METFGPAFSEANGVDVAMNLLTNPATRSSLLVIIAYLLTRATHPGVCVCAFVCVCLCVCACVVCVLVFVCLRLFVYVYPIARPVGTTICYNAFTFRVLVDRRLSWGP